MEIKKIENFAKEHGYDKIEKVESWLGYEIYEPVYDGFVTVGFPFFIMVKGDTIRLSTLDETMQYMDERG